MPDALYIGITEDQFWNGNPNSFEPYVKAFSKKKKDMLEEQNTMNHMLGAYFRDALMSTVGNMFSKKGTKQHEYPQEPYEIFKKAEEKKIDPLEEKKKTISFFNRLAANNGLRVKDIQ